jgi:predicted site-specific integrase-resolvase
MQGWASVKKAAKYADVSERTMRSWLKKGLKYSRLPSGMIRIQYSAIDEFLKNFTSDELCKVDAIVDEVMRGFSK